MGVAVAVAVLALLVIGVPTDLLRSLLPRAGSAGVAVHRMLFEKTIYFSGLQLVSEEALSAALPTDRSALWWQLHRDTVPALLKQHPFVADASMASCADSWWSCFRIEVKERRPRALVQLKDGVWAVDARGAFLQPVSAAAVERNAQRRVLPLVQGVDLEFGSPEVARARTRYAVHAMELIEQESGKRVEEVVMSSNGEISLRFRDLPFTAVFDSDGESLARVSDEARRLQALLAEFHGREQAIARVDLAYNTLAVVKLAVQ